MWGPSRTRRSPARAPAILSLIATIPLLHVSEPECGPREMVVSQKRLLSLVLDASASVQCSISGGKAGIVFDGFI